MALTDDDVREILRLIDESELDELRIEAEGFRLHVRRGGAPLPAESAAPPVASPAPSPPAPEPAAPGATASGGGAAAGQLTIEAPMLGTFYRAEAPGADPYVEVGNRVEPDTVVCLVEVMKMMNPIQAGVSGTIVEVCAQNAELVEFGEPLFRVEPAG